jgi:hypothetical protein
MPTPLTAPDEMIVPIPINPEYIKPKPVKLNADSVYFANKYQANKDESVNNFISTGIILAILFALMISLEPAWRYCKRKNWFRKTIN